MTTIARHIRVALALVVAVFAAATALPAAAVHAAGTEVKIDNFAFAPQRVVVKADTTVTWINDDDIPHTIASSTKLFNRTRSTPRTNSRSPSQRPERTSISAPCIRT